MPAEPTKAKLKRRSSKKDLEDYRFDTTHARELEMKRSRGEVSCAECRRLKIKCDKQIPCQSCQRRGCAALCPNGSLATGQGTRFVLAATEHLHRRISALSSRIRQLEDALATLQARHSTEPHPLLHEDLVHQDDGDDDGMMEMDVGIANGKGGGEGSGSGIPTSEIIDAFGTLAISDHGISRFFGPTGGSESLLLANLNVSHDSPLSPNSLDSQLDASSPISSHGLPSSAANPLIHFSQSFPFTPVGNSNQVRRLIESHLPDYNRAMFLCDTYIEQASWLFRGVSKAQLLEDMMPAIYKLHHQKTFVENDNVGEDYSGPHDLALLFAIFAVGTLVQPTGTPVSSQPSSTGVSPSPPPPPPSQSTTTAASNRVKTLRSDPSILSSHKVAEEAEHYYQLARAALALQPVLEKPSIVTIQSLHLMSIYNAMSGSDLRNETSMEMTWSLITLASHLSQTIGLHRDSARWGLSPKLVQRRRILFWDLFVADSWQSLNTGRPPSFSLAYIDCSFPQYDHKDKDANNSAFEIWQFRFAAECVADVTSRTLTAEAPSYTTILELDKKVRDFPLPEGFQSPSAAVVATNGGGGTSNTVPGAKADEDIGLSMQRCVLDHIRETVLMYIHRSFFAQAIIDNPANPLKSHYAPSFLASYRASSTILRSIREQFTIWPNTCARFWTMWTFAFTAAVVFGTVVTRGPRSPLATSAMSELEQACILFSKASMYSIRAAKALPILTRLSEKARFALATAAQSVDLASPLNGDHGGGLHWSIKQEDGQGDVVSTTTSSGSANGHSHGNSAAAKHQEDELSIFAGHTRFVSGNKKMLGSSSSSSTAVGTTTPGSSHGQQSPTPSSNSQQGSVSMSHQQQPPQLQPQSQPMQVDTTSIYEPVPHQAVLPTSAMKQQQQQQQHSVLPMQPPPLAKPDSQKQPASHRSDFSSSLPLPLTAGPPSLSINIGWSPIQQQHHNGVVGGHQSSHDYTNIGGGGPDDIASISPVSATTSPTNMTGQMHMHHQHQHQHQHQYAYLPPAVSPHERTRMGIPPLPLAPSSSGPSSAPSVSSSRIAPPQLPSTPLAPVSASSGAYGSGWPSAETYHHQTPSPSTTSSLQSYFQQQQGATSGYAPPQQPQSGSGSSAPHPPGGLQRRSSQRSSQLSQPLQSQAGGIMSDMAYRVHPSSMPQAPSQQQQQQHQLPLMPLPQPPQHNPSQFRLQTTVVPSSSSSAGQRGSISSRGGTGVGGGSIFQQPYPPQHGGQQQQQQHQFQLNRMQHHQQNSIHGQLQHPHAHPYQQQQHQSPYQPPSHRYQHQHQHQHPRNQHQITQPNSSDLADLGLASRDSRLDERWSLFMADSGLLDVNGAGAGY